MIESIYWMDGYGPYVWAAWLLAGLAIKGLLVWVYIAEKRALMDLRQFECHGLHDRLPHFTLS